MVWNWDSWKEKFSAERRNFSLRGYNNSTTHFLFIIDIIMEGKLKIFQDRKDVMTLGINSAVKSLPSQNLFMFSTKLDFKPLGWIYAVHQKKQLVHDKLDSPGSSPGGLHESDHPHLGFDYASTTSCLSWVSATWPLESHGPILPLHLDFPPQWPQFPGGLIYRIGQSQSPAGTAGLLSANDSSQSQWKVPSGPSHCRWVDLQW